MGLLGVPKGRDHARKWADQRAILGSRPPKRRTAFPVHLFGVRLSAALAADRCCDPAEGRRCVPRRPRRWLRLGEALLGTSVPTLRRGLWFGYARRAVPQHLRRARPRTR